MSKKISKIHQSRAKLRLLKEYVDNGNLGKIKPRRFSIMFRAVSSVVLIFIAATYVAALCHFFE